MEDVDFKQINQNIGRKGEELVKKTLWRRDYRVKDISDIPGGCDLLVNGTYRVEVKSTSKTSTPIIVDSERFDVLCVVFFGDFGPSIYYLKDKKDLEHMASPTNVDTYHITPRQVALYFTKKPQDVFVKK